MLEQMSRDSASIDADKIISCCADQNIIFHAEDVVAGIYLTRQEFLLQLVAKRIKLVIIVDFNEKDVLFKVWSSCYCEDRVDE